ncbi:MAG: putative sulfate/molybdate transporter [Bacteroidales bacterium]|nr:putative sulfate/molybdate transporter [Bacteroidales bacterium]
MSGIKSILHQRIKFNRNELSGAFGDIGTDLPLIIGMLLASDLQVTNVLLVFGAMQILTGFVYGIPMAVQPLKAVAMIVITQQVSGNMILMSGLLIGVIMFALSASNLLNFVEKYIPKTVIRGIQLGLGIQLALIGLKDYVPAEAVSGYVLAGISFFIAIIFIGNRKYPPAIFIILLGFVYSITFNFNQGFMQPMQPVFQLPELNTDDLWSAFFLLTLPQIPLSLGNSIFATKQVAKDLFPEKNIGVKKIGLTYSIMNISSPFLGGIPVCHGSGGLAGQFTFGGRTGGSVIIYGILYILLGLFFSTNFTEITKIFPLPVLGVILMLEGTALIVLVKDIITDKKQFLIAVVIALIAIGIPYGYFVGMVVGIIMYYLSNKIFLKHYGKQ